MLERWEREGTFEQLRRKNAGGPTFSFIDGPITANNPMGVHHAWGRTLKDLFQRYHAALGEDQRYQNGFDCQGLWVEVEVEKALGLNSKHEIEEYGLDNFARACRDRVAEYSGVQTRQSRRLGMWMDWERSYYTMTDPNISYIWGFLKVCHDKRLALPGPPPDGLVPALRHVAVAARAHSDRLLPRHHPPVAVRALPLHGRARRGARGLDDHALDAAGQRRRDRQARRRLRLGRARRRAARRRGGALRGGLRRRREGRRAACAAPSSSAARTRPASTTCPRRPRLEHRVVADAGVVLDEGTGIVHIAPGCGAEDFELGRREELAGARARSTRRASSSTGYGELVGHSAHEVPDLVVAHLERGGWLLRQEPHEHRYPHCWRCGTELIFRLVDEWFIRCDEIRQPMIDANDTVEWTPPHYGKRMEDWLRNMGDWCISRKRYWGLPLPFYFCADGHMTVVSSEEELRERATAGPRGPAGAAPAVDRRGHDRLRRVRRRRRARARGRRLLARRRHRAVLDARLGRDPTSPRATRTAPAWA